MPTPRVPEVARATIVSLWLMVTLYVDVKGGPLTAFSGINATVDTRNNSSCRKAAVSEARELTVVSDWGELMKPTHLRLEE